jgi:hypothetical protein
MYYRSSFKTGEYYWVAITIEFKFEKGDYMFQDAGLIIFEGTRLIIITASY